MPFARRLRLDFSPALFASFALWSTMQWCAAMTEDDFPWSVDAAFFIGGWVTSTWWIWADAIRQKTPLLPVWGLFLTFGGALVLLVYLFTSRGWWGFLTLLLYAILFLGTGLIIQSVFAVA